MQALFAFLFRFRATFLFLFLEIVAIWLVVQNNHYQSALYFNSANYVVASTLSFSNKWEKYFYLEEVNEQLAKENERLHEELSIAKQKTAGKGERAITNPDIVGKNDFILAKIVNKTTLKTRNYITIAKGRNDGVYPDMGVISSNGVVGRVKESSAHYARVMSILHQDFKISAKIKKNDYVSYVQWDGKDARFTKMKDVPVPIKIAKGDTIVASGYNAFFPQGTLIGIVEKVEEIPEATFHDITVRLTTHFNSLNYTYVVGDALKQEKDSLETSVQ